MRRVVITGMGCVSPFGAGVAALSDALREGRSAVVDMSDAWRDAVPGMTCMVGAPLAEPIDPASIHRRYRRSMGETAMLALTASRQAIEQAGLGDDLLSSGRAGCIIRVHHGQHGLHDRGFFGLRAQVRAFRHFVGRFLSDHEPYLRRERGARPGHLRAGDLARCRMCVGGDGSGAGLRDDCRGAAGRDDLRRRR